MKREVRLARSEAEGKTNAGRDNMSAVAECLRSWRREGCSATPSWSANKAVLQTEAFARWTTDVHNLVTLKEALSTLPGHLQEALYRYIYNGETQREIALRMGVTQQAIHYDLMLAIEQLSKNIA